MCSLVETLRGLKKNKNKKDLAVARYLRLRILLMIVLGSVVRIIYNYLSLFVKNLGI